MHRQLVSKIKVGHYQIDSQVFKRCSGCGGRINRAHVSRAEKVGIPLRVKPLTKLILGHGASGYTIPYRIIPLGHIILTLSQLSFVLS